MSAFAFEVPDQEGLMPTNDSSNTPTNVTEISHKLEDILRQRNMSPATLSEISNVPLSTIQTIIRGDSPYYTNNLVAEMICGALELRENQIRWPKGVSYRGRPGGTGKLIGFRNTPAPARDVCPEHFIERSVNGDCAQC